MKCKSSIFCTIYSNFGLYWLAPVTRLNKITTIVQVFRIRVMSTKRMHVFIHLSDINVEHQLFPRISAID